jgi:hypothetical protein
MAGRFAYFLIAGGAVLGGMVLQGDLKLNDDSPSGVSRGQADGELGDDRRANRRHRLSAAQEHALERQFSNAIAELARSEGALITIKLDDDTPATAVAEAEKRRDAARETLERLADDPAIASGLDRAALREQLRDGAQEAVRP